MASVILSEAKDLLPSLYRLKFTGIHRVTYLIDEKGKVAAVCPKVKLAEHARQILDFLDGNSPAIAG
jgi:peroxiredoxin